MAGPDRCGVRERPAYHRDAGRGEVGLGKQACVAWNMLIVWLEFAVCVAAIGMAGVRLSRHGDRIAALTGLSRNWIGMILVATVTSLPEMVTGLSAVTVAAQPDIAVGDALGSCVFNLAILAWADMQHRRGSLYAQLSSAHVLSAGLGILLLGTVALTLLLAQQQALPALGHVGLGSVVLLALYVGAMRLLYVEEQRREPVVSAPSGGATLRRALMGYATASAVIVAMGIWLPHLGVEIARVMGWSTSFVGTLFVALATSVPELATTWGAIRIGAVDLAVGNLLGSNLFDVLVLVFDDLAYTPGPLWSHVAPVHTVSAVTACVMSAVVIAGLAGRPARRLWRLASGVSLLLLLLYLFNAAVLYHHGQ